MSNKQVRALKSIIYAQQVENSQLRAELARILQALPPTPPPGWLKPKQVAALLDVSLPRVTQLCNVGKQLWSIKIGRDVWIDPASPALKRTRLS